MIALFASLVGPKLARPVMIGALVLFVVLAFVVFARVSSCSADRRADRRAADQAAQTTRSGEALSNAAVAAIETVINAQGRDAGVDTIVIEATKEIDNATNPDDARAAVLNGVCALPEYRNDPACVVR